MSPVTNVFAGHIFTVLLPGGGAPPKVGGGVGVIYLEGEGGGLLIAGIRGGISQSPPPLFCLGAKRQRGLV